jgi:hypothetical protein
MESTSTRYVVYYLLIRRPLCALATYMTLSHQYSLLSLVSNFELLEAAMTEGLRD